MCTRQGLKPILNVKNLSQSKIQNCTSEQLENGNAFDSKIKLDCNNVSNKILDNDIIINLSSDDEVFQIENKSKQNRRKPKKKKKIQTPVKDDENIKIERKSVTKKKLTKSTNLKTFAAKDHPASQTNLEQFFTITQNPQSIKYFDTFEKSNKPEPDKDEVNVLDYLEFLMDPNDNNKNNKYTNIIKSECVTTHFQFKKHKIPDNSDSFKKVGNYLQNNFILPEKTENILLNRVATTKNQSSVCSKSVVGTTNIYNSDCGSKVDSSESIAFHYNSIPSIKAESVIYSLGESDTVCCRSSSVASQKNCHTTNNSEDLSDNTKQSIHRKKFRKNLSFQTSITTKKAECTKENFIPSCSLITLPSVVISSPEQSCAKSKNTNSADSNNTSNSVFNTEQYKYNSYNNPILIEDNESEHSTVKKLNKPKSTIKSKNKTTVTTKKPLNKRRNRVLQCPSYKIVEGTTFAVDGFRFGEIEGVTHYFLTHFHGDHYIGLRKQFSMPIYMSEITATLVANFIHVHPNFLHIINPNETKIIDGIEVTSIDANHCPGAVMFIFKLPSGQCILHTGDFRACPEMESESYFWNNDIDTIYLDTTYLHKNYDFKPQSDSIADVRYFIDEFCEKHIGQRILYVCGSYVIGKEKVWAEIAKVTGHRVYTNGNRRKALTSIADPDLLKYLIDDPKEANIHVVTMNEVNYLKLYDYFKLYSDLFDVLLGIRPSGWEKNTKPQLSGIINVVGIEYSEHSSYSELRRFCRFLQPKKIISTVPVHNNDLTTTAKIPKSWLNNKVQPRQQGYQPSICSYISTTIKKRYNNEVNDDQEPTCSKYLKQNDHCSDIGMLDATKSSIDIKSPQSKLGNTFVTKEYQDNTSIDPLTEPLDDWMS